MGEDAPPSEEVALRRPDTGEFRPQLEEEEDVLFSGRLEESELSESSVVASSGGTPTLSLPDSFDESVTVDEPTRPSNVIQFETELRKQLQAELYRRVQREGTLVREGDALRARVAALESSLSQSRAALEERRSVIEAGFHEGMIQAQESAAGQPSALEELRQRPVDELTLRELATLRVAEAASAGAEKLATCQLEFAEVHSACRAAQAESKAARDDNQALEAELVRRDRRLQILETDTARLESELSEVRSSREATRKRLEDMGDVKAELARRERELNEMKQELEAARRASEAAAEATHRAAEAHAESGRRVSDAEALVRLAKRDKEHAEAVAREDRGRADIAFERLASIERELADRRAELTECRAEAAKRADLAEARLAAKTAELSSAAAHEIELLRRQRRETDKAELEAIREARRDAVAAAEREQDRRLALERDLEACRRERDAADAARLATSAELTAETKTLSFEVASLRARLDSELQAKQEATDRADTLRAQLDVAEREHAALEAKAAGEHRRLSERIRDDGHKLAAYEKLELELDSAVLRTADGSGAALALPGSALAAGLSRPERRVRHAVMLAQKLLETQATNHRLESELDAARAAEAAHTAARSRADARLLDASKPARYLLAALAKRDDDVTELRRKLQDARTAAQQAANQAAAAAEHNDRLEAEVHRLLKHRTELAQLKSLLSQLRSDPNALPSQPLRPSAPPAPTYQLHPGFPFGQPPNPSPGIERHNPPPEIVYRRSLASHTTHAAAASADPQAEDKSQPAPSWHSKHTRVGEVC